MPKVNKTQTSFSAGEVSKQIYGRIDNPRYEQSLFYCQNYLPLIQGPLTRRPGTKYVGYVKDSTKLPTLIPFQFSASQSYILEMGDQYVRFYTNEGQIVTSSNSFSVNGKYALSGSQGSAYFNMYGVRTAYSAAKNEVIYSSSVVAAGSVLEVYSPFSWQDIKQIKYAQKNDTIYFAHPNYTPWKLVRTGINTWDMKQVSLSDGPYLPLNSYKTIADQAAVFLQTKAYSRPLYEWFGNISGFSDSISNGSNCVVVQTGPIFTISSVVNVSSTLLTINTLTQSNFNVGDSVCIQCGSSQQNADLKNIGTSGYGALSTKWGEPAADTITNSNAALASFLVDSIVGTTTFNVRSNIPVFQSTSLGDRNWTVQPALFQLLTGSSSQYWADVKTGSTYTQSISFPPNTFFSNTQCLRPIALWLNATRYYGWIGEIYSAASCTFIAAPGQGAAIPLGSSTVWNLGVYNYINGFPSSIGFHQDRLILAGCPAFPQQIDGSMAGGAYEVFSASGSNAIVNANNAIQFGFNSQDLNQIKWVLSAPQGLLAGTQGGEWAVTPSTQNAALTPTNVKADQVTAYGSADTQAIFVGNAAIYIQRAQRKVRELLYYWQVGNFRSTNLSELSQHITTPTISKLVAQKEPNAFVWALRDDGNLLSLTYNRDDITLQANSGWARHVIGGQSDASGSPPRVNSLAVIPSSDTSFDELWMVTQRYLNGSTLGCVEFMLKPFDDFQAQETSCHLDCSGQYASSIVVSGLTVAGSCVVTAPNHGLANSSVIRFYNTVGMNISFTDINGYLQSSNPLNYQTFVVSSASTNNFFIRDFNGNYINTNSCSIYTGSAVVNKLVTSVSNIPWLAGETVSVVADGGIHVNTTVSLAGVLNLSYPAAKVNFGYSYNSDAQLLRSKDGSAQGTSIGATRRVHRVAFMLHNVGDLSFGPNFTRLIPFELYSADATMADNAPPLFDGIIREGFESEYSFDDSVCFRQNSGLPGMIQSVTRFLEEQDV